jgi:dUTP pyrophosphatase
MRVRIKRLDSTTALPQYQTAGSAAFDLAARAEMVLEPRRVSLVPTGLIVEAPEGYFLALAIRSSVPFKKGLMLANGIGIVDSDYCGPEDEVRLAILNFTDSPVVVKRGERLAQGLFLPVAKAEWEEVDEIQRASRGGFGSSG